MINKNCYVTYAFIIFLNVWFKDNYLQYKTVFIYIIGISQNSIYAHKLLLDIHLLLIFAIPFPNSKLNMWHGIFQVYVSVWTIKLVFNNNIYVKKFHCGFNFLGHTVDTYNILVPLIIFFVIDNTYFGLKLSIRYSFKTNNKKVTK